MKTGGPKMTMGYHARRFIRVYNIRLWEVLGGILLSLFLALSLSGCGDGATLGFTDGGSTCPDTRVCFDGETDLQHEREIEAYWLMSTAAHEMVSSIHSVCIDAVEDPSGLEHGIERWTGLMDHAFELQAGRAEPGELGDQ